MTAIKGGNAKQALVREGESLLDTVRDMGLSVRALCGSRGICGSCRVRVLEGELTASAADIAFFSAKDIAAGWRLACVAYPKSEITVEIPDAGEDDITSVVEFAQEDRIDQSQGVITVEQIEMVKSKDSVTTQMGGHGRLHLAGLQEAGRAAAAGRAFHVVRYGGKPVRVAAQREEYYAIGVDIGTTTIGFALVDLRTASMAGRLSIVNKQREYGADVVTRIVKAKGGDLALLSKIVRAQLAEGIGALCRDYGVKPENVLKVAIAGNTTMLHLLLELCCDMLGHFPFTPVTLEHLSIPYGALFDGGLSCDVDILPGISTYVGADITAGLLHLMLHKNKRPSILLDIGTNGEMALAGDGRILCTSTAAGPALEGVNIVWGTGSVPGAISSVAYGDGCFQVTTIGGQTPVGICGSGIIDTVYQFLRHGIIDETGRLQGEWVSDTGVVVAKTVSGEDIYISQKDIREIQLAKSAIRAGIEILIKHAGLAYGDIETLHVAGGFGYNIDFQSGVGIGLVPAELGSKIKLAGNSSLGGVVSYLINPDQEEAMHEITSLSSEFSLSEDDSFQDLFVEYMSF